MGQGMGDGAPSRMTPSPSGQGVVSRLRVLCADATRSLAAAGVGVSVMAADGVHGMAAASDPDTERIEELQFTVGEGPCVDAYASRRPVLITDLDDTAMTRWPAYSPAVHQAGIRAVFAFPLQVGAARLGVLDVFRSHAGPLSRGELGQAFTFADLAVATLLDGQEQVHSDVDEAVEQGAALWQAQGMVMVMLGISLPEALVRLRAHAFAVDRRLSEVAADIVAGRLHLDRDQS